jgi:hypothetical protein
MQSLFVPKPAQAPDRMLLSYAGQALNANSAQVLDRAQSLIQRNRNAPIQYFSL